MIVKSRILYIANHYRGPQQSGGNRSWHQVRALAEHYEVDLLVPSFDPLTQMPVVVEELPVVDGVHVKIVPAIKGGRRSIFGRLVYAISTTFSSIWLGSRTERPIAVIAMGAPPTSALAGWVLSRMKGVPLMLDVRDIPLETALEREMLPSWFLRLAIWFESRIFQGASHLVCVSEQMMRFLEEKGISRQRMSLNMIGYDAYADSVSGVPSEANDFLNVMYAGTLAQLIDIPTVLRAAEQVRQERVRFIVLGDGERLKEYREWSDRQRLNVEFRGRVTKQEVHDCLNEANVCLYPLTGGAATAAMLGNKVFDYLGAGKPVIYTGPPGSVSQFLDDLGAGFVLDAEDDQGLSALLRALTHRRNELRQQGDRARSVILSFYTAAISADQLVSRLQGLLAR